MCLEKPGIYLVEIWICLDRDQFHRPRLNWQKSFECVTPDGLCMKWLPDCLFEVECETTTDLLEMGRIFLEPNLQLEVSLGLYAKTFPPETIGHIGLEPIFPTHAPQPRSKTFDVMMISGSFI